MTAPALFTDLYELKMAQAYLAEGMNQTAVFELAFRKMPAHRNYLVAAGIGDVVDDLLSFRFQEEDIEFLRQQMKFPETFLRRLKDLRFSGDVFALPEGTMFFPNEPAVQVVAPMVEAQLMETLVLNRIHFQSLAAAKAARVVQAAQGRAVVDFGSRRAHGIDAALKVARATYLAGGVGTSNVLAAKTYSIPAFGTMAHSYIQAHESEIASFEAFAQLYPDTTLLVDTYDTLEGVRNVIELSRKLGARFRVSAIRLDSGDLGALSRGARDLLDQAGLHHVTIFASSSLDEYEIQRLIASGAPIDAFGVGTKLAVADDAPFLDMAYKLVEYAGRGRLKLSSKKVLYPGRKQVFRQIAGGRMTGDVVGRCDEDLPGERLLQAVMLQGQPVGAARLEESRQRFQTELGLLPDRLRALDAAADPYPVSFSQSLQRDLERLRAKLLREQNERTSPERERFALIPPAQTADPTS